MAGVARNPAKSRTDSFISCLSTYRAHRTARTHQYGNMGQMKTTLDLPDELLIQAKKAAAEQRRPLRALVEEGLRMVLREPRAKARPKRVRLITVKGGLP